MSNENTASKGVGSTGGSALNCRERINDYLSCGGLFNPEMMEHEKVRELLLDCREEIMDLSVRATGIIPTATSGSGAPRRLRP